MINNELDVETHRQQLAARGRVQIPDFLQLDAAERLRDCLAREVHWTLAERSESTSRTRGREHALTDAEYREVLDTAYARARDEFQFVYDSFMLVRARKEGWDPDLVLHFMLDFLNSPEFLEFARYLTNDAAINAVNAQATRYRPGHFLTPHEDISETEGRRYVYVINLTQRWQPEWGRPAAIHRRRRQRDRHLRAAMEFVEPVSRSGIAHGQPGGAVGRRGAAGDYRMVPGALVLNPPARSAPQPRRAIHPPAPPSAPTTAWSLSTHRECVLRSPGLVRRARRTAR